MCSTFFRIACKSSSGTLAGLLPKFTNPNAPGIHLKVEVSQRIQISFDEKISWKIGFAFTRTGIDGLDLDAGVIGIDVANCEAARKVILPYVACCALHTRAFTYS
jgi:hypothetical protein